MAEEIAFFELLASSAVFEEVLDHAKSAYRETVSEIGSGSAQMRRDTLEVDAAMKQATASMAAMRAEATAARYAAGQVSAPALALSQARSRKASLEASVATEELSKAPGPGVGGLGGQLALLGGLGIAGSAIAGLAALDQLVNKTAQHSAEVLRNSQTIGLNNQQMQVWDAIAEKVGLDQETLVRSIGHFNVQLAGGAPALKSAGIDLKDLGITSNNTGTALLQAADYFHTHTDAVQNDQIAMALFGRQGLAMLPILSQGSEAIRAYGDELKRMGMIFSDSELASGAATEVVHQRFIESLQALEGQVALHLEPAFIQLYQTISTVINNSPGLFDALADGVAHVVGFIAGLIAGLTGVKVDFGAGAISGAGSAFDGLGSSATNAAGSIDGTRQSAAGARDALAALREATRLETNALDDQITAIQGAKQAYDDQVQAQKDALQDQLDSVTNVTDHQRRQGEDLVSYRRRLAEDDLKNQIKTLDEEKTSKDRAYDEQVKALEGQKQALQRHLADEQAAVSAATGSMAQDYADAYGSAGASANSMAEVTKKALSGIDTKAFTTGQDVANVLKTMFADPGGTIATQATQLGATVGTSFGKSLIVGIQTQLNSETDPFFHWLSNFDVGLALLGKTLFDVSSGRWLNIPSDLQGLGAVLGGPGIPSPTPGNGTLASYAEGGVITRPQIAMLGEAGPEVVIPLNNPARSQSLLAAAGLAQSFPAGALAAPSAALTVQSAHSAPPRSSGGVTQHVTFNGPVATEYVAGSIAARLARDAQQKSLALRAGLG